MRLMKLARARAALGLVAVATAAMLVTPMLSAAQSAPAGAPAPAAQESAQTVQAEFLMVQQELAQLEKKVLEDPTIRQEFDAVQASIQEAATALDARHQSRVERLGELQQELKTATANEKTPPEDLEALITEARGLQERIIAVQDHVVRSEPLKTRIAELRARMTARMAEIDPAAPKKLERLTVLAKSLSASGG